MKNVLILSNEELSTVLAALAVYDTRNESVRDIATGDGSHEPLTQEEVVELSEKLNMDTPSFIEVMEAFHDNEKDKNLIDCAERVGEYCGDNHIPAFPVPVLIDYGVAYVTTFTEVPMNEVEEENEE